MPTTVTHSTTWVAQMLSVRWGMLCGVVTAEDVRRVVSGLPRAYEALVRDRAKFRIGRIVFLSFSPDEKTMGFAYPKEARAALVEAEPHKFHMPVKSDMRYNWVRVWLDELDEQEMRELVVEAWAMCVPKKVAEEYFATHGLP